MCSWSPSCRPGLPAISAVPSSATVRWKGVTLAVLEEQLDRAVTDGWTGAGAGEEGGDKPELRRLLAR